MTASDNDPLVYANGSEYNGGWNSQGQKHGQGVLKLADGSSFIGQFKNGYTSGSGCYTAADGSRYQGEFFEGKFHGYGCYLRSDGLKFEGQFVSGKPDGLGIVTFRDGTHGIPRQEGFFENFKLKRVEKCTQAIECARKSVKKSQEITSYM